jgi:monoamine oxidase
MNCLPSQSPQTTAKSGAPATFPGAPAASRPKIAIVGGGPGGLLTAYLIQKKVGRLVDLTVFEASERLGGKILTPQFSLAPITYEAGAAEFYDYTPVGEDPLKDLIRELGLPIAPMGGSAVIMDGQVLSNLEDVESHFGLTARREWLQLHLRARDLVNPTDFYLSGSSEAANLPTDQRSFQEYLQTIGSPELRTMIGCQIHSDLATEPEQTSVEYGLQNYLMNDPDYLQLYGIEGGNERLPQELIRRCNAEFRLNQPVMAIGKDDTGNYQVESLFQGKHWTESFQHVVIALPHDALPRITFQGERLANALQRLITHHDHPAHYLRITLLFARPFWRGKLVESFCMLDHFGGCCLYDESSRTLEPHYGVLGWLLGGQAAVDHAGLPDAVLTEMALDSLPIDFGDARGHFVESRVHRWLGAVNAMPGGRRALPIDQRHCPEPIDHRHLWLVGDYLYDSTLNGVFDSADYVSDGIVAEVHA